MRLEQQAAGGQGMKRTLPQRQLRVVSRKPLNAPLQLALGGMRLPLALLIITTISRAHQYFGFLDKARPALLLFLAAVVMFAFTDKKSLALDNWKELPIRLVLWLAAAAVLSGTLGMSFGGSLSFFLNNFSKVLILSLLIAAVCRTADELWTMVWAYVIGVGILSWMAMFVYKMRNDGGMQRLGDGYTYDANDMGLVCITGIPLALITFRSSGKNGKLVSLVILALDCVAIARTGSRGAFLGLLALALSLLFLARGMSVFNRLAIAVVGAAAMAIAAPKGYMKQMQTITDPTADYNWTSRTGRKEVAKRGWGYLQQNLITGIGIMNFPRAEGTVSEAAVDFELGGQGVKWSAAHNTFLQAFVEMGFFGGGIFVAIIWVGITCGLRMRRKFGGREPPAGTAQLCVSSVGSYLPLAFIGFSVSGFFLSFAYMDPLYILTAFAAGAMGLTTRMSKDHSPAPRAMAPPPSWVAPHAHAPPRTHRTLTPGA